MKRWLTIAGFALAIMTGGYLALSFYGVKWVQSQIQEAVVPGVSFDRILVAATHLSIHRLRFEDPVTKLKFFEMEQATIYPDLWALLKKRLHFRKLEILKPSFSFYRTHEESLAGPWIPLKKRKTNEEVDSKKEKKERRGLPIKVDRIRFREGAIEFDDRKTGGTPGRARLGEFDLTVQDIEYPLVSRRSPLELRGKVTWKTHEGEISSKGWIDLKTSEMEISLRVRDMEIRVFEPYYRKRVSAEIESGRMNMDASIQMKDGKINAQGRLDFTDLFVKGEGTVFHFPAKTLSPLLKGKGNRVRGAFHVKGDAEDPRSAIQETFFTQVALSLAVDLGMPVTLSESPLSRGPEKGP